MDGAVIKNAMKSKPKTITKRNIAMLIVYLHVCVYVSIERTVEK